jgi:hypothetical protein
MSLEEWLAETKNRGGGTISGFVLNAPVLDNIVGSSSDGVVGGSPEDGLPG